MLVNQVVVDAERAFAQLLLHMQDDFKTVAMQPPALVALWHVRQTVRGLQPVTTPEVGLLAMVQVHAFVGCALNAEGSSLRQVHVFAKPPGEVLVRGAGQHGIQVAVVQWLQRRSQARAKVTYLTPWKRRPASRQRRTHAREKGVAVKPAGTVTLRKKSHLPRSLERERGGMQEIRHSAIIAGTAPDAQSRPAWP